MAKNKTIQILQETITAAVCVAFSLCMFYACASMGTPSGGPIDEMPPRFVSSNPAPNTIRYNKNKIEIVFDEIIALEKPMDKVIITPPQIQMPEVKALGKKITVELKDSLKPNTTYTIDFTDAISDNNEHNPLENFSFAFSTGDVVDSLIISGALLNAENLEPMPNILVGLHSNLNDSAFVKTPFSRTTKTNDLGKFWIRNISPGTYRIFALNDLNRDYRFDQPGEEIAFDDSLIVPSFEPATRQDTIWKDTLTVDTIMTVKYNRFTPDNIVLFLFKEQFERQYLRKSDRPEVYKFSLFFNTPVHVAPKINLLNADPSKNWIIPEYVEEKKTINYWITDSLIYQMDTLHIETTYIKSDSLNNPVPQTDTLSFFVKKAPKKEKKDKDKEKEQKIDFLKLNLSSQSSMEIYDSIKIAFSEPPLSIDPSLFSLERKKDTIKWEPMPFTFIKDTLNPLNYTIYRKWEYESEYRLRVDSATIFSIYGKWNDKLESKMKFKNKESYSHIYFDITGYEGPGYSELLDASDKPLRKSPFVDGGVLFMNVKPSKYYIRFVCDRNNNGKWDPGNYNLKQQPEEVYYYPSPLELKQNWDFEQPWNLHQTPILRQKPLEITKNKPKENPKKRSQNETTNNRNSSQATRTTTPNR